MLPVWMVSLEIKLWVFQDNSMSFRRLVVWSTHCTYDLQGLENSRDCGKNNENSRHGPMHLAMVERVKLSKQNSQQQVS